MLNLDSLQQAMRHHYVIAGRMRKARDLARKRLKSACNLKQEDRILREVEARGADAATHTAYAKAISEVLKQLRKEQPDVEVVAPVENAPARRKPKRAPRPSTIRPRDEVPRFDLSSKGSLQEVCETFDVTNIGALG